MNDTDFLFDINKDGQINNKDVVAIKATKPYLKNEYYPENRGVRIFRGWSEQDKNRLLSVVNANCIKHYSSWEALVNDRYIKCSSISMGRIGWKYWSLQGSQSSYSNKLLTCFILGVLIPGFLLFLFIKFTKIGRNLKNSFRFKFIITVLILYFSIVYFIFSPITSTVLRSIYKNDLVTVKKYWMFINPEVTKNIMILFLPSFPRSHESKFVTLEESIENPLKIAIASGSKEIVKFLIEEKKLNMPESSLFLASGSGSLPTVKYLVETLNVKITDSPIRAAFDKGFLDIGQYLISQYPKDIFELDLDILAMSGDLELFKKVMSIRNYTYKEICIALKEAIRTYNNNIAKYIIYVYPEIFNVDLNKESKELNLFNEICYNATIYDDLEILSILVKRQPLIAEHNPLYM